MTLARAAVTAALALCLAAAVRAEAWLPSSADRVALERREVVVHSAELPNQPASERGREVRAAIRIRASAERIFAAMTHCETALQFVPKLRKCVLIERDPQTGAEIIEHEVDYGWYAPAVNYTFRAEYEPNRSVTFTTVAGDLARNEGRWELTPLNPDPVTGEPDTLLTYRVVAVPRIRIPQSWVRASLTRELPRMLRALRDYTERD
ncbi:MAG TPA: SRPBCC family protein [Steroidobacteraceae bacterium]|nr:SRPBCC family protein [Steroidobacteraceae bacterium]HRX87978.1 SRPBCC family protein [Steroidobacteraceae bacterium]